MPTMLITQLDYIYFAYGLVLLLLGAVCVSMSRNASIPTPWPLLGAFAVLHGIAEWLHLAALAGGDSPAFKLARELLITSSFLFLLEFARQAQKSVRGRTPGRWILLLPAGAVLALALLFGPGTLASAVRPLVAAPAIFWTAWLFLYAARHNEELGGGADGYRARVLASVYFTLFGLVSGLVVPAAPFLPVGWPSGEALLAYTGIPIQLLRAATVCMMALSVWALAAASDRNLRVVSKRRLLFWVTASSVAAVLVVGALFTNWLGRLHESDSVEEAESAAALVHDHLATEMAGTERGARILSGLVGRLQAVGGPGGQARLDDLVDSVATRSDDWVAYVLDPAGTTIATSNRASATSLLGKNFAARPYFQAARAGRQGRFLGMGLVTGAPGYFASEPVLGPGGRVLAIAVVKRTLGAEQLGSARVGSSYLADGRGQVMAASRAVKPGLRLWEEATEVSEAAPGSRAPRLALLDHTVTGTEWVQVGGERTVAIRLPIPGSDWSLLVLRSEKTQVVNRLLGIVITLLFSMVVLGTFVVMQRQLGAESWMADQRRDAETRARDSARQADTDALTGVLNRLGFEAVLGQELERSRRYGHPLSVVMLDLDHFKRVNDTHGHGAGDQVLVGVARILETNVRDSDSIGRLGGEEFMVLAPATPGRGAVQLAEKLRALTAETPLGPAGIITGSFGVAELRPGETAEALLRRADQALYAAKSGGRNRVSSDDADVAEVLAERTNEVAPVRPMLSGSSIYAATGYGPIDDEHRALSEAIDALLSMLSTARTEEVQVAFESILNATAAHFGHEERLMKAHAYPGQQRHHLEHLQFIEEAGRLLADLEQGGVSVPFRRWSMGRLPEWFRLHILEHDLDLGAFLHGAEAGAGALAASRR
jgi:diguanylate cyclase (GGDEF)-like protein/hemerythrin-like metal-binding protein